MKRSTSDIWQAIKEISEALSVVVMVVVLVVVVEVLVEVVVVLVDCSKNSLERNKGSGLNP